MMSASLAARITLLAYLLLATLLHPCLCHATATPAAACPSVAGASWKITDREYYCCASSCCFVALTAYSSLI
jgi:hypothetical protein